MSLKSACLSLTAFLGLVACSNLPTTKHDRYRFPEQAYIGTPKREYQALGLVRAKVNFTSLDPVMEEGALCANYFNKAARDLLRTAREKGADAVIDVKSVVFFENGKSETFSTPECADDGAEGQILAQGIAVKWKKTQ